MGVISPLFSAGTYDHTCFATGLTSTALAVDPGPDDYYFLVSAVAPGYGEGSLGADSAGNPIPNTGACP